MGESNECKVLAPLKLPDIVNRTTKVGERYNQCKVIGKNRLI